MMIPKKIHYCWFGGKPLNKLGKKCLKSWEKFFPDYQIIEWNEKNFDIESCQYVKEAYAAGKWAFVSDYARYKILYEEGGIYFDTDVEVIATFDDILEDGPFMGCEEHGEDGCIKVAPGLGMAAYAGMPFYKEMLVQYECASFIKSDGSLNLNTIVDRTTDALLKCGLEEKREIQIVDGITVYTPEFFCPINMITHRLCIKKNTRSIHRFAASWVKPKDRFRGRIYACLVRNFGRAFAEVLKKWFGRKQT